MRELRIARLDAGGWSSESQSLCAGAGLIPWSFTSLFRIRLAQELSD